MNLVGQYSSDSESESENEVVEPAQPVVSSRVTTLVPRQVLLKSKKEAKQYDESEIALLSSGVLKEALSENLFGIQEEKPRSGVEPVSKDEIVGAVREFERSEEDKRERDSEEEDTEEVTEEISPPKRPKIIHNLDMNQFYRSNAQKIESGELTLNHSTNKYYAQGNNNLAHVIRYTEKNDKP